MSGERTGREVEVGYRLDDQTVVWFEIEPTSGFRPANAEKIVGPLKEALAPLISVASYLLDRMKEASPNEIEVKFGIKVSGATNWIVAKAATEGNFEIRMTWKSDGG